MILIRLKSNSVQENNEEKTMKNKYEKEKDDILDFLAREVTCSVCLMIPRTKRIPICRNGHTTCETCKGKYLGIRFSEIYLPGDLFQNGRRGEGVVVLIHLLNRFKQKQTCFLVFIFTIYINIFVEKKVKDKTLVAMVILFFISNSLSACLYFIESIFLLV